MLCEQMYTGPLRGTLLTGNGYQQGRYQHPGEENYVPRRGQISCILYSGQFTRGVTPLQCGQSTLQCSQSNLVSHHISSANPKIPKQEGTCMRVSTVSRIHTLPRHETLGESAWIVRAPFVFRERRGRRTPQAASRASLSIRQ